MLNVKKKIYESQSKIFGLTLIRLESNSSLWCAPICNNLLAIKKRQNYSFVVANIS